MSLVIYRSDSEVSSKKRISIPQVFSKTHMQCKYCGRDSHIERSEGTEYDFKCPECELKSRRIVYMAVFFILFTSHINNPYVACKENKK